MSAVGSFVVRRPAAAGLAIVLVAGCASGEDDSASSTTVTTTTLPPSSTTTTIPPRAVTEVDVCALLREADLARVLEDAGVGEAPPADEPDPDAGVPAFIAGQCAWPSLEDPALVLHYLAPTTAPDGPAHLADVLETGTGFAEGGRVLTQAVRSQTVGILVDAEQRVRELAVVNGSALLYVLLNQEVGARDTAAMTDYAEILYRALRRAPR